MLDTVPRADAEKVAGAEGENDELGEAVDDGEPVDISDTTAVVLGVEDADTDADTDVEPDGVADIEVVREAAAELEWDDDPHEVGVSVAAEEAEETDDAEKSPESDGDELNDNDALGDSVGAGDADDDGVKDTGLVTVGVEVKDD